MNLKKKKKNVKIASLYLFNSFTIVVLQLMFSNEFLSSDKNNKNQYKSDNILTTISLQKSVNKANRFFSNSKICTRIFVPLQNSKNLQKINDSCVIPIQKNKFESITFEHFVLKNFLSKFYVKVL